MKTKSEDSAPPRRDQAFRSRLQRYVGRSRQRREQVDAALKQMAADVKNPLLQIHSLVGEMSGKHACSCGYDGRIVFQIESHPAGGAREILLLDVGTHDEVY